MNRSIVPSFITYSNQRYHQTKPTSLCSPLSLPISSPPFPRPFRELPIIPLLLPPHSLTPRLQCSRQSRGDPAPLPASRRTPPGIPITNPTVPRARRRRRRFTSRGPLSRRYRRTRLRLSHADRVAIDAGAVGLGGRRRGHGSCCGGWRWWGRGRRGFDFFEVGRRDPA